jgi:hypothetical protein
MKGIVEHRSALPVGPVVEVHVRYDADAETPVFASVGVSTFGAMPDPEAFPNRCRPQTPSFKRLPMQNVLGLRAFGLTTRAATSHQTSGPCETRAPHEV